MPAIKAQSFCPCSMDLNRTSKGLKGLLWLFVHACQFENFLVSLMKSVKMLSCKSPFLINILEFYTISNINLWGWNAVTIITGTNRDLCYHDVAGTIPDLWVLKSSVSAFDKIPFGRPMSQVFPSHKNFMFLTTHTDIKILWFFPRWEKHP
jgi:hypothetical protein